jgi:ribose 5-phosphate isomerase A
MSISEMQQAAAEAAVRLVRSGMVVGLGTGATAAFAIDALILRAKQEGLKIRCVPTSDRSAEQARAGGLPLTDFDEISEIDLTIDGADEIARGSLHLIKGRGGALLREKIVASISKMLVIVADSRKLVDGLGGTVCVPMEVVSFGWQTTSARLVRLGAKPALRRTDTGAVFRTDENNLILDCHFGPIADPAALERELSCTVGVVETGIFIGMAHIVLIGGASGVVELRRS